MTLKELYDALVWNAVTGTCPYVKLPGDKDEVVLVTSKILEEYGSRIVHDITILWEEKRIIIFLKATNKEIADAYFEGFFRD